VSEEREIELVAGTIGGITQKKADTWTVAVTPEGSQYAKNLWSKDADLIDALSRKIGEHGAFVCGASYWQLDGKQVRSLWIDSLSDGTENVPERVATPAAAQRDAEADAFVRSGKDATNYKPAIDGMSKEEWARKDSAIHKMACIKTAADALKHTVPSDPSQDDLAKFMSRCAILYTGWHRSVIAERDDPTGMDIPFD
jgi:leucyl aminopeptidase (aminopeptidase T)